MALSAEDCMREAIKLADSARARGDHPFGSVLVIDGEIVLRAENTVNTKRNFTHHAETNLMNLAVEQGFTREQLEKSVLYASGEPCSMCSGAIYWSGVKHVVFGCTAEFLGEVAGEDFVVPCRNILSVAKKAPLLIEGPLLEKEAEASHDGFWVK